MSDISTVVNDCINYSFVKPFIQKKKYMSYEEKEKREKYFARMIAVYVKKNFFFGCAGFSLLHTGFSLWWLLVLQS